MKKRCWTRTTYLFAHTNQINTFKSSSEWYCAFESPDFGALLPRYIALDFGVFPVTQFGGKLSERELKW